MFSLSVIPASAATVAAAARKEPGFPLDTPYTIVLDNKGKTICDVEVIINKKGEGLYRIEPGSSIWLARAAESKAPFRSPAQAGGCIEVQAKFIPEMRLTKLSDRRAVNRRNVVFTGEAKFYPGSPDYDPAHPGKMCGGGSFMGPPYHDTWEPSEPPSYVMQEDGTFVKTPAVIAFSGVSEIKTVIPCGPAATATTTLTETNLADRSKTTSQLTV